MKRFTFIILILTLLLTTSCKDITFRQASNAMSPTIKAGDVVYCDKIQYQLSVIERGDIVITTSPAEELVANDGPDARYIFRIIGIGGDKIQVIGGRVIVNDKALGGAFASGHYESNYPVNNYGPVVVPQGEYFLVGDNLANSFDSRYWKRRTVKGETIIGKATMIKDGKTGEIRNL